MASEDAIGGDAVYFGAAGRAEGGVAPAPAPARALADDLRRRTRFRRVEPRVS